MKVATNIEVELNEFILDVGVEPILNAIDVRSIYEYLDDNYAGEAALTFAKNVGYGYLAKNANENDMNGFMEGLGENTNSKVQDLVKMIPYNDHALRNMTIEECIELLRRSGKLNQIIAYMTSKILSTIDTI